MNESLKILVIDDEEILRHCLDDILSDAGFKVQTASSGEEGLQLFEEEFFEIILLDIKMPGMSGIEVLKAIKKINPETKVIIITGYASVNTAVESMKLGASDYLTKPFDMNQIKESVYQLVETFKPKAN